MSKAADVRQIQEKYGVGLEEAKRILRKEEMLEKVAYAKNFDEVKGVLYDLIQEVM